VIKRLFIAVLTAASIQVCAQGGFGIGYNTGIYTQSLHNLEVLTYEFNVAHPNYENQYKLRNLPNGPCVSFFSEGDNSGLEIMWSNKHVHSEAEGADNPGDTVMRHKLKARINTLQSGCYYKLGEQIRVGISYDMGFFRVFKKVGPAEEFGSAKWEKVFDKKGFFSNWFTFFIDAKVGPLHLRPYYQAQVIPGSITYSSRSALIYKSYAFYTSNTGVTMMLTFGGNK
jgi:hypothetical protein